MYLKFTNTSLLFALFITSSIAQQQISGIINQYAAVTSIDYCKNALVLTSVNGFSIGEDIILMQMQGATIEEENNNAFGTIRDIGASGRYEKANIQQVRGDTLFLGNSLLHTYFVAGNVQVISYPKYDNVSVSDTLKAKAWNGKTGGILAFQATTLTLNAPIIATGIGFRGGATQSPESNCTGGLNNAGRFFYTIGDWRGAFKGEGIALGIVGKELGRGPLANGGGGGNDHNSGGGGGSNVVRGGDGGIRPTPFITLSCRGDNPGKAGVALNAVSNRIFMGGGGGAGHTNNSTNRNGGNGGGIVIIEVNTLVGNNRLIAANGASGIRVTGDGGSGGGAGGTVILLAQNVNSMPLVEAKGGNGASVNNNNGETCFGPGGGGGGGYILSNINNLTTTVNGGESGRSTASSLSNCNNTRNNAEDGQTGIVVVLDALPISTTVATVPAITNQPEGVLLCLNQNVSIEVETAGSGLTYQWEIDRGTGNGFEVLVNGVNYSGVTTRTLNIIAANANMSDDQLRLIISTECGDKITSAPIALSIGASAPIPNFRFQVLPDGAVIFTNQSQFGMRYLWNFGDGVTSASENTAHTYPLEGAYQVTLTAFNDCGEVSSTKTVEIVFPPKAAFGVVERSGCVPVTISFQNQSTENVATFEWQFPGGSPASSIEANPTITYDSAGLFDVILIVTNIVGTDTLRRNNFIEIAGQPNVNFIFEVNDLTVTFTNTSTGNNTYTWNFNDQNSTSTQTNPTHTFSDAGIYEVTLNATNNCGTSSSTQRVAVGAVPLGAFSVDNNIGCAPLTVQYVDQSKGRITRWAWSFPGGAPATSNEQNPTVRYTQAGNYNATLIVENDLGKDSIIQRNFVQIYERPLPKFEFEVAEGKVNFVNLTEGATFYGWAFGDGKISTEDNPTHTYAKGGLYYVTLNAYNNFCGATVTLPINIVLTDITQLSDGAVVKLFPNPMTDWLQITFEHMPQQDVMVRLFNLNGQLLTQQLMVTEQQQIDVSHYLTGTYILHLSGKDWTLVKKVVKQ